MKQKTRIKYYNEVVLAGVFLALFIAFSIISPSFLTLKNTMTLLSQMVELGVLTLGMAATMISGGMDLSLGTLCSMCTVTLSIFIGTNAWGEGTAMLLTLIIALVCGAFNGFMIGYLNIQSMLVTLGTQSLFKGIGLVVSNGLPIKIPTEKFALWGRVRLWGFLPFQVIVYAAAIAVTILIFNYTITGRRIYLVGSNTEVARFAGINIKKSIFLTYVFSAFMAFVASLTYTSKVSCGRADLAEALILKTVCASVFGGVSTLGGIGNIAGAVLGVAVITIISNGLDMMNASVYFQQIVIGGLLLLVLAFRHGKKK